jgi:DNA-directed RNA polymerase specialized sigma24 family protein
VGNLERRLGQLRAGEIEFGAFVRATRNEYRAMAQYLMRKWATPEWFVAEDVEQELYLDTWRKIGKYDPEWRTKGGKAPSLQRYIVFNAMGSAKRAMHVARGAGQSGSPDKRPGRFETPLSRYEERQRGQDEGGALGWLEALMSEENADVEAISATEEVRAAATAALKACATMHERYAVLAIREAGSLDMAPAVLYDDFDHRLDLRLGSEEKAERFVRRHAAAVAGRMMAAAR